MSYILYKIEEREIVPTEDTILQNDRIYIIIDKTVKKSKIWIWSGSESRKMDRYFAGVSATKIKSKKRLYGASIEVVEGGNEPPLFPILNKETIIEATKEKIGIGTVIVPLDEQKVEKEVNSLKTAPKSVEKPIVQDAEEVALRHDAVKNAEDQVLKLKEKLKDFMNGIALDMEVIQKKVKEFLVELK